MPYHSVLFLSILVVQLGHRHLHFQSLFCADQFSHLQTMQDIRLLKFLNEEVGKIRTSLCGYLVIHSLANSCTVSTFCIGYYISLLCPVSRSRTYWVESGGCSRIETPNAKRSTQLHSGTHTSRMNFQTRRLCGRLIHCRLDENSDR